MGLTDLFNNLIVEHGSSIVKDQHLSLFKDQLLFAEREKNNLELKVGVLETRIKELEEINAKQNKIIKRYEQFSQDAPLSEIEDNVLIVLVGTSKTTEDISKELNKNVEKILFCLKEMKTNSLVELTRVPMVGEMWELTQKSRKYLIDNNLID